MTDPDLYPLMLALIFAFNVCTFALWRNIKRLRAELADLRANSHRRDPRTGRLLPLGK